MTATVQDQPTRKVGILLGIGIFLLPIIFSWFTLRTGHSTLSRIVGFGWLAIVIIAAAVGGTPATTPSGSPVATASSETRVTSPARRSDQITMAQYNQIQPGMSYSEVVAILGRDGEEMSSSDVAGIRTILYGWSNRSGANMNAMFQQDAMVQKAQFGLR